MKKINLEELDYKLNQIPFIVKCNPLSLAFLEDLEIISNIKEFICEIDSLKKTNCKRYAIIDYLQSEYTRFPLVDLLHDPFRPDASKILFNKYKQLPNLIFNQKQIPKYIVSNTKYDVIFLILIDGLSYENCRERENLYPCFVNGATLTEVGFRNIIGDPPIAYRLYKKYFKNRFGFSYWNRENKLSNIIFNMFDKNTQMFQTSEFDEIFTILKGSNLNKTYIQILLSGLDEICHKNWDRPPIKAIVNRIFEEYIPSLTELILSKNLSGMLYVVSDHGIWWKPEINSQEKYIILNDKRAQSKRFFSGHLIHDKVIHVTCYGKNYSLLKYPYIFTSFKKNEWGCHGGISYHESIVPFFRMEVY